MRMKPYRPIDHPAVEAVACPYCYQPVGAPCRPRHGYVKYRVYVETHVARVKAAQALVMQQQYGAGPLV